MKLKLIAALFLSLLPLSGVSARTNGFDSVLINQGLIVSNGTKFLADFTVTPVNNGPNLFDTNNVFSLRMNLRQAFDQSNIQSIDWSTVRSLNVGASQVLQWGNQALADINNQNAILWGATTRQLVNQPGAVVFGWSNAPTFAVDTFFNSNAIISGSLIVTNVNLLSTINTGASTNLTVTVNSGAGRLSIQASHDTLTNMIGGLTPTVNVVVTNNMNRAWISGNAILPANATQISSMQFFSIDVTGTTNKGPVASSSAGFITGSVTNWLGGWVDPAQRYWFSNMITTAGTPTLSPDYLEKR